jgi:hypothetical protein
MKLLFAVAFLILSSLQSFGQNKCDLSSLPIESKDSLMNFWKTLKESVQQKDSSKLMSICSFPFYVSYEILTGNTLNRAKSYEFSSTNIMPYANLIFYDQHFMSALSQCADPTKYLILHGNFKTKHKICNYVFCYTFKNMKGIDEERCFSITRVDNTWKLGSHWIRQ